MAKGIRLRSPSWMMLALGVVVYLSWFLGSPRQKLSAWLDETVQEAKRSHELLGVQQLQNRSRDVFSIEHGQGQNLTTFFSGFMKANLADQTYVLVADSSGEVETASALAPPEEKETQSKNMQSRTALTAVSRNIRTRSRKTPKARPARIRRKQRTPVVYSRARTDRSGMAILDMLKAHAYAFQANYTYGGACQWQPSAKQLKRKQEDENLLRSLGLAGLIKFACPPRVHSKKDVETIHRMISPGEMSATSQSLFTSEWLSFMQSQMSATLSSAASSFYPPSLKVKKPLKVVLHIRRGDVKPCTKYFSTTLKQNISRYLPNSYYELVMERYFFERTKGSAADALDDPSSVELSIYSEKNSFESWDSWTAWSNSVLRRQQTDDRMAHRLTNVTLQLDQSLESTWAAMRTADVLVMSKSAFSFVPALLNFQGRIIFHPLFYEPLSHWSEVDKDIQEASGLIIDEMQRSLNCFD